MLLVYGGHGPIDRQDGDERQEEDDDHLRIGCDDDRRGIVFERHLEDLLQQFDDDALQRLEEPGNPDSTKDYTGGKKWAAIIRQIKSDPDLYSLDIVNKDDSVPAICFNDDPEHAVVVFRGTSGKDEWIDNAIGLGVSDTERQKAALDYIENLPYDSITVAGHSKGGNKAQYVTVLSD